MSREHKSGRRDKRSTVLLAAQSVFLSEGFESASMVVIAHAAGVSKQTVYNHFGNKQELFHAVVQQRCSLMASDLDQGLLQHSDDVEKALIAYGQHILDVMLSTSSMRMRRLVQSESGRYPELGEVFYRLGPDAIANRLSHYLAEQNRKGTLALRDPRMTAEQFLAMLPGQLRLRHLLGLIPPPTPAERRRWAVNAVQLLLDGSRPR